MEKSYVWSADVWALGVMLIEIVSGVPLWLPLKCQVVKKDGKIKNDKKGVFGVKSRSPLSIIKAQEKFMGSRKLFDANMKKIDRYALLG